MNDIKTFIIAIVSGVLALLSPIKDFMHAMICLFLVNFLFGVVADYCNGGKWSMKKAMVFFYHVAVFFLIASCVFFIGHFLHNENEALYCVKTLCLVALWFYTINILKNLRLILVPHTPMHALVNFLYYVVSLKLVHKIPYLSDYITETKNEDNGNKN